MEMFSFSVILRSSMAEDFPAVDQYQLQCDTAAAIFRNEAPQEFPIEDAITNMRVIDAVYRAAGLSPRGLSS